MWLGMGKKKERKKKTLYKNPSFAAYPFHFEIGRPIRTISCQVKPWPVQLAKLRAAPGKTDKFGIFF